MHSHDRTMIQRLGFADPDKGDSTHDDAVQYLCRQEVWRTLWQVVHGPSAERPARVQCRTEYPLCKGEKQYKTTLGFIDAILQFHNATDRETYTHRHDEHWIAVEVKTNPIPVGTVIRQINFYKNYFPRVDHVESLAFVVATTYPISAIEAAALNAEGIYHVLLGERFHAWRKRDEVTAPAASVEV